MATKQDIMQGLEAAGINAYAPAQTGAVMNNAVGAAANNAAGTPAQNQVGNWVKQAVSTYAAPKSNSGGNGSNTTGAGTSGNGSTDTSKIASESDVLKMLQGQMASYQPLSKDEIAELKKRRKAHGIVSGISDAVQSLSNLYFTSQYAPNAYDPKNGMSEKLRERWEKAKAERQAKDAQFANLAINYANMLGRKQDREQQAEHWRQQMAMQREQFNYRKKQDKQAQSNWQATFEFNQDKANQDAAFREKQFDEGVRQFDENLKQAKAELGIRAQQLALAKDEHDNKYYMTFNLGPARGGIKVPLRNINEESVARVFSTLPPSEQDKVKGKAVKVPDEIGFGYQTIYESPTMEQKLAAIGAYVGVDVADHNSNDYANREAVRQAIVSMMNENPTSIAY